MSNEDQDDADGRSFGNEERTAVLLRRLTRAEVAGGLRNLAAASKQFWGRLHEGARFLDEGTALGLTALTEAEAEDLSADIDDMVAIYTGVQSAIKRASGPGPSSEP